MSTIVAAIPHLLTAESLDASPYLDRISHLFLAGGLGLFVGMEREYSGKQAGLRTFGFVALVGCAGAILGTAYGVTGLALTGLLVAVSEVEAIMNHRAIELTTMVALLVTCFVGILAGEGHVLTPTTLAVVTAGLLAWKERLAGFTVGLTIEELRSAILLAVLAFVIYPLLPSESIGPEGLIDARLAWLTVLLIAVIGFANYILLKLYGQRGIEFTGFLGGLVNSTVTATELAMRAEEEPTLARSAYRGITLSTSAMAVRNAVIVGVVSYAALTTAIGPLALMVAGGVVAAFFFDGHHNETPTPTKVRLRSPFSLTAALKFGALFLAMQIVGGVANNAFGGAGLYGVAVLGGFVSSASAVGSAAALAAHRSISPATAGIAAVLASLASTSISIPIVARVSRNHDLTRRVSLTFTTLMAVTLMATLGQTVVRP